MNDLMTVADFKEKIQAYCEARNWDQFHGIKDLSIGLVTEACELLEIFRFKSDSEIEELMASAKRKRVEDELADVLFFVIRIAEKYKINLSQAFLEKMKVNAAKYPVEKAFNSNKKYDEF
ncbi:MAG: nucleotide pyrophosphohydrolase [Pseudomonadota bacterium]|nr:nucleotide pyrophosphohydrolase [Pseudomonadota bacterium]